MKVVSAVRKYPLAEVEAARAFVPDTQSETKASRMPTKETTRDKPKRAMPQLAPSIPPRNCEAAKSRAKAEADSVLMCLFASKSLSRSRSDRSWS